MLRRIISALAILGIIVAFGLYLHATSLYSTATSLQPARGGYKHFGDYWCLLNDQVTFTGQPNPGRPFALACTYALAATLLCFWFSVSALFADRPRLCITVRITGAFAAVAGSLIFTSCHDLVITAAAPLGFLAVLLACIGLAIKRRWFLLSFGILAVSVSLSDYLLWKAALLKDWQPLIQKSAFSLIFLWVLFTAFKTLTLPDPPQTPPSRLRSQP